MNIVTVISVLTSKVALTTFVIVVAKFISKRIGNKVVDRFLMKIHRPAGYALAVTGFIHGIFSFLSFDTVPIIVYILGSICFLAIFVAIVVFIFRKRLGAKWRFCHRISTIVAFITLVLHLVMRR